MEIVLIGSCQNVLRRQDGCGFYGKLANGSHICARLGLVNLTGLRENLKMYVSRNWAILNALYKDSSSDHLYYLQGLLPDSMAICIAISIHHHSFGCRIEIWNFSTTSISDAQTLVLRIIDIQSGSMIYLSSVMESGRDIRNDCPR